MQCPVCRAEVNPQSSFCSNCGAPIASTVGTAPGFTETMNPPPPPAGYPPQPPYGSTPYSSAPGLSNNAASAIAYLTFIPAIIFLVLEPYNKVPLVRFHAWQSIALAGVSIILHLVITMCSVLLHFIPGIFILFSIIHFAVGVILFVLWLIAIIKASQGEWYKLPIIGDFALRQSQNTTL